MTVRPRISVVALLALGSFTLACASSSPMSADEAASAPMEAPERFVQLMMEEEEAMDEGGEGRASAGKKRARSSAKKRARSSAPTSTAAPGAPPPPAPEPSPATADLDDDEEQVAQSGEDGGAPTRAWFPETFLFRPEVVTDASGKATVSTRVPDRLTTWRVLALAHDRTGHQAGTVTRFTSSLPLYADPVVPASLRVGDRVQLAIPIINTTDRSKTVQVDVEAEGLDVRGGGVVRVGGLGSAVARADLAAVSPGTARVHADLSVDGTVEDAVEHSIPVIPKGQRHSVVRAGTLGAPRTVDLPLPSGADASSAEARLTLVPGGLGVMQAEVASASARAQGADGAGLLLMISALAPQLWETAGIPMAESGEDPAAKARFDEVRNLRLLGVQQAMRVPAGWDLGTTLAITAGATGHPSDPVLSRLTDRGIDTIVSHQRPDGTFGGDISGTWTIQRMLVATATAVEFAERASAADPELAEDRHRKVVPVRVRGQGAAERFAGRVTDAYTASALIVGGLVEGETQARLATVVREALKDGTHGLVVSLPKGVARVDGRTPSQAEAAALAAQALHTLGSDDDTQRIADLGATVLASFRPGSGWGDASTDLRCLLAVSSLWAAPPAESVTLTLKNGDDTAATRTLTVEDLRNPVFLTVPVGQAPAWTVTAEPAVPGLAYALEVVSYSPWTDPPHDPGIDVEVSPPTKARLGHTSDLVVDIGSHRGTRFDVHIELPAGVQADAEAVSIEGGAAPEDTDSRDGSITIQLPPLATNRATVHIPVSPTLAGTVWSGRVEVVDRASGARTVIPPTAWTVGG